MIELVILFLILIPPLLWYFYQTHKRNKEDIGYKREREVCKQSLLQREREVYEQSLLEELKKPKYKIVTYLANGEIIHSKAFKPCIRWGRIQTSLETAKEQADSVYTFTSLQNEEGNKIYPISEIKRIEIVEVVND